MRADFYQKVAWAGVALALCVIVLGAWVRLSHAGLGCPDWPGCYGQITWPRAPVQIDAANQAFPDRPVEIGKAWREMLHRYLAGGVLLIAYFLAGAAFWRRRRDPTRRLALPVAIAALVTLQALFGMWTVTWKLLPVVVTAHLLGGMACLVLLTWLALGSGGQRHEKPGRRSWIWIGVGLLGIQILLGGWTSSNYAAMVCPDFPTCGGAWWPQMDFAQGFELRREIGVDYSGGVLDYRARVAIHMAHRLGALVVSAYLLILAGALWRWRRPLAAAALGLALALQVSLGVANVLLQLPLTLASAHNGGAALLLLVMVVIAWRTGDTRSSRQGEASL